MWLRLAETENVGPLNHTSIDGLSIVFGIVDGRPFAFDSSCPHKGGPLQNGDLVHTRIICPWHRLEFDVFTGKIVSNPYPPKYGKWREAGDLRLYRTELKANGFYVELPQGSSPK